MLCARTSVVDTRTAGNRVCLLDGANRAREMLIIGRRPWCWLTPHGVDEII
jgi:hypothetical protein